MAIEAVQVIQDLAIVMVAAVLMAAAFHRLGQPLLAGYILAGIVVGPYTPPFSLLLHPEILDLFAQIGIVFLLLAIGIEYPAARLRSVGRVAIIIALCEALATFAAGYAVGTLFGLPSFDSLFLGLALSVTSTVILAAVLDELGLIRDQAASLILGITVIEDIVAVSLLGILQSLAATGRFSVVSVTVAIGLVLLLVLGTLFAGSRFVPLLIDRVGRTGRRDLLLLLVLGLALGLSILSNLIGISVATGAFLAGVLVAESKSQAQARELVTPIKELFAAIFFVSIGALMDFSLLPPYVTLIAAFLAVSLGVKFVASYLAARTQRVPEVLARRTAVALSGPRGELSLVVAKGGADVGVTSAFVLPVIGAITLVTSFLAPYLVRFAWRRSARSAGQVEDTAESAVEPSGR